MMVSGIIKDLGQSDLVNDRTKIRKFVIMYSRAEKFPKEPIYFTIINTGPLSTQLKCEDLDKFKVGDEIEVHFNLRGREVMMFDGRMYFNLLQAWKIEKL